MIRLISILVMRAMAVWKSRAGAVGVGATLGGGIADYINLDFLRRTALEVAPGSDAAALEEGARTAARLLGLEGEEILWPRMRDGNPIVPHYMIVDLSRGRGWFASKYRSSKSVNAAFRRGASRGRGQGMRQAVQTKQLGGR